MGKRRIFKGSLREQPAIHNTSLLPRGFFFALAFLAIGTCAGTIGPNLFVGCTSQTPQSTDRLGLPTGSSKLEHRTAQLLFV